MGEGSEMDKNVSRGGWPYVCMIEIQYIVGTGLVALGMGVPFTDALLVIYGGGSIALGAVREARYLIKRGEM